MRRSGGAGRGCPDVMLPQLAILCAQFGADVPYRAGLDAGFSFRGKRVPYLSPQKGIFRAAVQRGPAALSIQTSANTPYRDVETPDGFLYDYRAGSIDQADNRALRAAHDLQVPLVYFVGTRRAGIGRTSHSSSFTTIRRPSRSSSRREGWSDRWTSRNQFCPKIPLSVATQYERFASGFTRRSSAGE